MTSVECPHQQPAERSCPGCTLPDKGRPFELWGKTNWCAGEITAIIIRDSDGDINLQHGVRTWLTVDDERADCGCILSEEEWVRVMDDLIESGED